MSQNLQPQVYSYTRFSTKQQKDGDSERRQLEAIKAAEQFAAEKGLPLDERLRMVDRGYSGFHGKHKSRGALGEFLKKVDGGEIAPGSYLLVENMDRLSREPVLTALETVIGLLKRGIIIQTLNPWDTYTIDSVNNGGHWRLIAHIERANAESERKSKLAKSNWLQKRRIAAPDRWLTSRAPAWFRSIVQKVGNRVVNREVVVIPEAVDTVRRIFQLKLEGFGVHTIQKKLNQNPTWIPPERGGKRAGWRSSYIKKILRNRAVIGEFQAHRIENGKRVPDGEPIPNYFKPIVSPNVFHAVQKQIEGNQHTGGRTGLARNVLKNLCKCGYCGGPVVFVDKGDWKYLACDTARRGAGCSRNAVDYFEVERTVLENCAKLRPELILPDADEEAVQAKHLRTRLGGIAGEITEAERQMNNLVDQLTQTSVAGLRARCEARYEGLEKRKAELRADHEKTEATLVQLERGRESFDKWQKNLDGLAAAIRKDADTRIRLNCHLKEFITKIEIFGKGHEDNHTRATEIIWESAPEIAKAASFPKFSEYLRGRLVSSEGRFFKIHFNLPAERTAPKTRNCPPGKTYAPTFAAGGARGIEIAPAESLAYRVEVRGKERKYVGPPMGQLCNEFFDRRKPGYVPKTSLCASTT